MYTESLIDIRFAGDRMIGLSTYSDNPPPQIDKVPSRLKPWIIGGLVALAIGGLRLVPPALAAEPILSPAGVVSNPAPVTSGEFNLGLVEGVKQAYCPHPDSNKPVYDGNVAWINGKEVMCTCYAGKGCHFVSHKSGEPTGTSGTWCLDLSIFISLGAMGLALRKQLLALLNV